MIIPQNLLVAREAPQTRKKMMNKKANRPRAAKSIEESPLIS
jgi:hypothetical protein